MDLTFISIHDLSSDARILYTSDSIVDVLGYTPDDVVNKSCWDFFPEAELPYAKDYHKRGIEMDRAAMLAYCQVKNKDGEWLGCECCFTIVYDVMVVCTSIYQRGLPSQKRASDAPVIRRLFSSSPKDPRYHMLSHISAKFSQPPRKTMHEPRAALFLNRFTRTLTIMYATSGLEDVLGIPAEVMRGRSFYYCIAENCLQDAIKCLENAKGNDSIAYLRFWFRDPRTDDEEHSATDPADDSDTEMTTESSVDQDFDGGVDLNDHGEAITSPESYDTTGSNAVRSSTSMDVDQDGGPQSRTSSGDSSTDPADTHEAIFGTSRAEDPSSSSSPATSPDSNRAPRDPRFAPRLNTPVELEAVISCASDGLVVCLRRARPIVPLATQAHTSSRPAYPNGLFAAPWATDPLVPSVESRTQKAHSNFAPSLGPQNAQRASRVGGPDDHDFMQSIRDQAIFAWALTGINGSLQRFGSGTPSGESLPPGGLPVWQNDDKTFQYSMGDRTDSASSGLDGLAKPGKTEKYTSPSGYVAKDIFGDPGLQRQGGTRSS